MSGVCGFRRQSRDALVSHRLAQLHRAFEVDRDELRHAAFGHGDAVEPVHARHGDRIVGDDHEARVGRTRHLVEQVAEALDDHNIERFCDRLDEMTRSTDTRFVIITHNPITMARMNRLYGVTMAERGVSQLVSVDLEGAVKLREAV